MRLATLTRLWRRRITTSATHLQHPAKAWRRSLRCERALEITEATLSASHPRNGKIYSTMAYLQFRLKNFERSYQLDQRALRFNARALGAEHARIADAHQSLGRTRAISKQTS